jgi:ferredoxin-NADP reductase
VTGPTARPNPWRLATVVGIKQETPRTKTFRLSLPEPLHHRAGQHVVVRLTAPDGYTASRSYSIASAPDESSELELTVERLDEGEVSMFLHDEVVAGDELEIRGPIGGWFVWEGDVPALLVGGGSGVVPLMAMLRLARRTGQADLVRVVVSVRTPGDLYFSGEIGGPETTIVYTRATPPDSPRLPGRLTSDDVPQPIAAGCRGYVCGSSGFADAASRVLLELGIPSQQIRVERFGPTA